MIFDGVRQPNTIYAASVSRGKDSTAMLLAIEELGFPLDAIYAVDIWATDDIPAELPPMVSFKDEWDRKCLERFGIPVTRLCATRGGQRLTYEKLFYRHVSPERERERESQRQMAQGRQHPTLRVSTYCRQERGVVSKCTQTLSLYGFPIMRGAWCNSDLKRGAIRDSRLADALGAIRSSKQANSTNPTSRPWTRGRR